MISKPVPDLLADLERAIELQRQALRSDDADALETASQLLGATTAALARSQTRLDANQLEQIRRLQIMLQTNRELLDRASATRKRALDALIGPNTTYSSTAGATGSISGSRVRTA